MKAIYTCFPGGAFKVLTLNYDDGKMSDRRLVDICNRAGIKAAFHLNAGFLGMPDCVSAGEVASLYHGHEVAAHGFTHPTLTHCPREQTVLQILECRRRLEDLVGAAVRGFAYPNGAWNADIAALLPALGVAYARRADSSGHFNVPDDLYAWRPTCHHNDDLIARAREFNALTGGKFLFWFSVWGHSWEFERDGNWYLFEEFARIMGGRQDVWHATAIEVVDYLAAARAVRVAVSGAFAENPSARPVWLFVDGRPVEIPGGGRVPL